MIRKTAVFLLFLLASFTGATAQTVDPNEGLVEEWEKLKQEQDTIRYVIETFGKGRWDVTETNFDEVVNDIVAVMSENPSYVCTLFGMHDGTQWIKYLRRQMRESERQKLNAYSDAHLSIDRALMVKRRLQDFGVPGERIYVRALLEPRRRGVRAVVTQKADIRDLIPLLDRRFTHLESQIDTMRIGQEDLQVRIAANERTDANQDDRLDNLETRMSNVENDVDDLKEGFLGNLGLVLGAGGSWNDFATFPEGHLGVHWNRRVQLRFSFGYNPDVQDILLDDEGFVETRELGYRVTLAYFLPLSRTLAFAPMIGAERTQLDISDFDRYVEQKDTGVLGGIIRWAPTNAFSIFVEGAWTPGRIDPWNKKESVKDFESARFGGGIALTLGG